MSDTTNEDGEELATKDGIDWLNKKRFVGTSYTVAMVLLGFSGLFALMSHSTSGHVSSWYVAYGVIFYLGSAFMMVLAAASSRRGYAHVLWNSTFGRVETLRVETTVEDYE